MATVIIFLALTFASCYTQTLGPYPFTEEETLALNREVLDYHNWQRHFSVLGVVPGPGGSNGVHPGASDMLKLRWDDGLAGVAQRWSESCTYFHNPDRDPQSLEHKDTMVQFVADAITMNVGENIGFSNAANSHDIVLNGLQSMMEESTGYNFGTDVCTHSSGHCGHYTQQVWATTRVMGCGYSRCSTLLVCNDDGSGCDSTATDATYFVCNYWPLGNRYTSDDNDPPNKVLVPIYTTGTPCANCPWDHATCNYDTGLSSTYDPDWHNTPGNTEEIENGLCVGCGNKYYEICATGLNNGLNDNCQSNINNVGCFYDWEANSEGIKDGQAYCDPVDDVTNGLEDPEICTISDRCRYLCGSCFCQEDNAKFKACDTECDDGLGRTMSGGCAGDSWFESYLKDTVGGCPEDNGGGGVTDTKWPWDGANQIQLSTVVFLLSSMLTVLLIA